MSPFETERRNSERSTTGRRSNRARWFRRFAVLLGMLPLVLFELGLRRFADPAADAVDLDPVDEWFESRSLFHRVDGPNGGRWEIPESRRNYFRPASFSAVKHPDTRRVFVLGGSTVQGRPYATETAFSTWLRFELEADPEAGEFEVVNCGGVSYASYRIAKILDEVLLHEPDAIVLYAGHNEFLEDRAYEPVRTMHPLRRQIDRVASKLHIVRWIRQRFLTDRPPAPLNDPQTGEGVDPQTGEGVDERAPGPSRRLPAEVDTMLDHASGMDRYRRDPAYRERVESQFEQTLQRMIVATQSAEVPIVVCVPASDLVKTPPFKVATDPSLSPTDRSAFNAAWESARDPAATESQRIAACRRGLAIDPEHAGCHYVLGTILQARRQRGRPASTDEINRHLTAARDHDVCPLRATTPIVDSVIRVADRHDVPVVDVRELFDTRSVSGLPLPDGIPDPAWFVDHVHPSVPGHRRIAAAIAERFGELGWIRRGEKTRGEADGRAREHLESLGEAYYRRGQQRLEGLRRWAAGRSADVGSGPDP